MDHSAHEPSSERSDRRIAVGTVLVLNINSDRNFTSHPINRLFRVGQYIVWPFRASAVSMLCRDSDCWINRSSFRPEALDRATANEGTDWLPTSPATIPHGAGKRQYRLEWPAGVAIALTQNPAARAKSSLYGPGLRGAKMKSTPVKPTL